MTDTDSGKKKHWNMQTAGKLKAEPTNQDEHHEKQDEGQQNIKCNYIHAITEQTNQHQQEYT